MKYPFYEGVMDRNIDKKSVFISYFQSHGAHRHQLQIFTLNCSSGQCQFGGDLYRALSDFKSVWYWKQYTTMKLYLEI